VKSVQPSQGQASAALSVLFVEVLDDVLGLVHRSLAVGVDERRKLVLAAGRQLPVGEFVRHVAGLETAGVQAETDSLTIDGTTYNESDDNTTITYRVAGTPNEDPSEYQHKDLDAAHEIIEVAVTASALVAGRRLDEIALPTGSLLISTADREELAGADTVREPGERYILAVESGVVDEVLTLMRG